MNNECRLSCLVRSFCGKLRLGDTRARCRHKAGLRFGGVCVTGGDSNANPEATLAPHGFSEVPTPHKGMTVPSDHGRPPRGSSTHMAPPAKSASRASHKVCFERTAGLPKSRRLNEMFIAFATFSQLLKDMRLPHAAARTVSLRGKMTVGSPSTWVY